LNLRPLA